MELRQLQTFITLINCDFNVTLTAQKLFLVQSAVSQQLKKLEQELGSSLFIRKGKRLLGLTDFGLLIEQQARVSLSAMHNIQSLAAEQQQQSSAVLRIGCTHTQARYVLPPVIKRFNRSYSDVELQMHQGNPQQLVEWAIREQVDFSICTEELAESSQLQSIPCYQWNRCLITLPQHPLQHIEHISLRDLCDHPIITYVLGFTGRKNFNDCFTRADLKPDIVLSAADTDIIKAYVLDGLGIGIIANMAYDETIDSAWQHKDLSHLFPWEVTRIAYLKSKTLRRFQQTFIDLFLETIAEEDSNRFKPL